MFNLLVAFDPLAWETENRMAMRLDRFNKGYSDWPKASEIDAGRPESLKTLESIPTLLAYESGGHGNTEPTRQVVRYGTVYDLRVQGGEVTFLFNEEGRFPRSVFIKHAHQLSIGDWEADHTHWAVKDGNIPAALLDQLQVRYDVVFSFAGEDRKYVEQTAKYLRARGVKVFYDNFEETALWGKDLAVHFDWIYRKSSPYCVMFISQHYLDKVWTQAERRSVLAKSLFEKPDYILPVRFDDTEILGVPPTIGYLSLKGKTPADLAKRIIHKVRPQRSSH